MSTEEAEFETNTRYNYLLRKAIDYHKTLQWAKALKVYKQILNICPNDRDVLFHVTNILYKVKLNSEAEIYAFRIYKMYPDDESIVDYSWTLIKNKKYNKAIELLEMCKKVNSQDYGVYNNLGYTYFLKGQYSEALENYDISIGLVEKNPLAYCNRGILKYFVLNDNDGIEDLKKAADYGDLESKVILTGIVKSTFN